MSKSRARKFAELIDANGDVKASALDNTSSDLVDDVSPQLGADLDLNSNDITGTGDINVTGTVTATSFSGDGSSLTGVTSVGGATGVDFNDNVKLRLGTGNDFEMFHDGSNTVLREKGTGDLYIQAADQMRFTNVNGVETYAVFNEDGAVSLYHDNSAKFQTTANGIETLNGTDVSMSSAGDGQLRIDGNGYTGAIALNNANMHIYTNSSARGIIFGTNETQRMRISGNGDILSKAEGGTNEFSLRQGSAKVWANFDMYGTYSTRDTYNVTSLTDNGTGAGTCNYNNDFNNANRAVVGTCSIIGSGHGNRQFTIGHGYSGWAPNELAGSNRISIIYGTGASNAKYDADYAVQQVTGDLA